MLNTPPYLQDLDRRCLKKFWNWKQQRTSRLLSARYATGPVPSPWVSFLTASYAATPIIRLCCGRSWDSMGLSAWATWGQSPGTSGRSTPVPGCRSPLRALEFKHHRLLEYGSNGDAFQRIRKLKKIGHQESCQLYWQFTYLWHVPSSSFPWSFISIYIVNTILHGFNLSLFST